jgi:hypothetical protein
MLRKPYIHPFTARAGGITSLSPSGGHKDLAKNTQPEFPVFEKRLFAMRIAHLLQLRKKYRSRLTNHQQKYEAL